jgi:hypothetical protein
MWPVALLAATIFKPPKKFIAVFPEKILSEDKK